MDKLPPETRVQILSMLVEGSSMRAISRVAGVSINTVTKLLEDAGETCIALHDEKVRNVKSKRLQCDEIWSFNYCKKANLPNATKAPEKAGDVWTWTAVDADSKLIISYFVGNRDGEHALEFIGDLGSRLVDRPQITTDWLASYISAIDENFGIDVDFAQLIKSYSDTPDQNGPERRYSPGVCTGISKRKIVGNPAREHVSTSYVESHNQKIRAHMRRFTRLTAGHSKKFANHCHALALYFMYYNFVKIHSTLRMSPAMAAGIETRLWEMSDIVAAMDDRAPKPGPRGPYRKAEVASQNSN
ncbi:MAG TPA: IS1 family transposase [Micropepsaceae bacterium]|nr:IS1 family transposase [Micropepsaceae bacterium]